jgi:hypothetical protein
VSNRLPENRIELARQSTTDEQLERVWADFLGQFDDAVSNQIEQHQAKKLIPEFDARPVAITRIWMSTLYESTYLEQT